MNIFVARYLRTFADVKTGHVKRVFGAGARAGFLDIGDQRVQLRPMLRRNVLIFHSGALGDFVLSWPLALALGRLYPQSRIIYVAPASKGKLAERVLRIESVDGEA